MLRDRVGGAPAVDAVGRTRIVAKPVERDLRVIDEIGSSIGRRAVSVGASQVVPLDGASYDADAGADRRATARALAATDNASNDRAGDTALHSALDHLRGSRAWCCHLADRQR